MDPPPAHSREVRQPAQGRRQRIFQITGARSLCYQCVLAGSYRRQSQEHHEAVARRTLLPAGPAGNDVARSRAGSIVKGRTRFRNAMTQLAPAAGWWLEVVSRGRFRDHRRNSWVFGDYRADFQRRQRSKACAAGLPLWDPTAIVFTWESPPDQTDPMSLQICLGVMPRHGDSQCLPGNCMAGPRVDRARARMTSGQVSAYTS